MAGIDAEDAVPAKMSRTAWREVQRTVRAFQDIREGRTEDWRAVREKYLD